MPVSKVSVLERELKMALYCAATPKFKSTKTRPTEFHQKRNKEWDFAHKLGNV